jgi:N-methylhydantoinase A
MAWRIGVDIGGTFTDVVLVDEETGRIGAAKAPTTPRDITQGVIDGICQGLTRYRVAPSEVTLLAHATTIVTNALIEKKGAKAGFVTTRSFRDVLSCAGRRAPTSTTSFKMRRQCWCRAAGALRSPSGSMRRDKS